MTDVTESQQHNETDVVMAAEWGLQPPDYAPKARTQLFDIHDTAGNDSNLLIVFYVQIMPDDFVMQLHRF